MREFLLMYVPQQKQGSGFNEDARWNQIAPVFPFE